MSTIVTAPPSGVYESWNESTAPVDVSVVALANVAEFSTPKRVSVPSVAAPTACGTVPRVRALHHVDDDDAADRQDRHRGDDRVPVLVQPTIRPNVRGRLNEITSSRKIWIQFVQVVGFSNGCAELAL